MVRLDGIEPTTSVWKTEVLPLNYSRERGEGSNGKHPGQARPQREFHFEGVWEIALRAWSSERELKKDAEWASFSAA